MKKIKRIVLEFHPLTWNFIPIYRKSDIQSAINPTPKDWEPKEIIHIDFLFLELRIVKLK